GADAVVGVVAVAADDVGAEVDGNPDHVAAVGAATVVAPLDVVAIAVAPDDVVAIARIAPDNVVATVRVAPDDVVAGICERLGRAPHDVERPRVRRRLDDTAADPMIAPDELPAPARIHRQRGVALGGCVAARPLHGTWG